MYPESQKLFKRAQELMPGGVNSPVRAFRSVGGTPFFTQSADGCRLKTADGQALIDYVCTWGPAIHGHNHPEIRKAVEAALHRGTSFGTPNPLEVELAELIVEMVPSIEKVRMTNSGTEATMASIRLARGYTGRDKIIKFAGCYHGHVDSLLVAAGSGAVTFGNPDSAGVPASLAKETIVLPFNDLEAVERTFREVGDQIAAIILEPYPANCGLIIPEKTYLQGLRRITSEHGALLIFDEVMTGFRLAPGGVQELTGVTPDLTALGKIIGGGLPVGAFGGSAEIMDHLAPIGPVYQAGTLSGNPLAMAAGIASLMLLHREDPYVTLHQRGHALRAVLRVAAQEKGIPIQVPQVGSMFAIFFTDKPVTQFDGAKAADSTLYSRFFRNCLQAGLYLPPSMFETCFVSTAHGSDAMNRSSEILTQAIEKL